VEPPFARPRPASRARLRTLEGSLSRLAQRDAAYRLMAGLEPTDRDVLLAGIGGPDTERLETSALYTLDARTGRRAFETSLQLNALVRRADMLASSWNEAERVLTTRLSRLAATPTISPARGYISSAFTSSRLHPILERRRAHTGIDIVASIGTPVVASAGGRVSAAGPRGAYGLLVEIDHGHGTVTRYAHLSRIDVRAGQTVDRGQTIGAVGTTGLSAGPHLHYEVLVNGRHANPRNYIFETDVLP
jgi:murein DD-endopeptidase MepM/ murein hydrolase activator NlpD